MWTYIRPKGEHFYKYFFKKLISVKFPPFFEFLLFEIFFGLPLNVGLESKKNSKIKEFLIFFQTKLLKKVLIKNVHL